MIDKQLTVVVQGPVDWNLSTRTGLPVTWSLCSSIRRILPRAELILSTWSDSCVDGLQRDVLIVSQDPGPQGGLPSFTPNNVNRQIVSTLAGLNAATRRYCLKMRSDIEIFGGEFLECLPDLPVVRGNRAVFKRQVIANNLSSRNSLAVLAQLPDHPLLFHPSDHMHGGLTEDIRMLWDIPLQADEDATYFVRYSRPNLYRDRELSRLAPEQHIFTSALEKRKPLGLRHYAYQTDDLLALSGELLSAHFLHIPDRSLPIYFGKYHTPYHFSFDWMRIGAATSVPRVSVKHRLRRIARAVARRVWD